jgi:Bacterial toxin 37
MKFALPMGKVLTVLAVAIPLLTASSAGHAGWLRKATIAGAAVAGYEFETIAAASVAAVMAADTPAYRSSVEALAAKIASHQLIGPLAFHHGQKQALKLFPMSGAASSGLEHDLIALGVLHADGPPDMGSDPKSPGKPTEADGYKEPKNWDGKLVKNPNGRGYGYPAKDGTVWVPTGPRQDLAHGGPHWDVQKPGGGYDNVYPGGKRR